jgi:hypothetical protein
MKRASEACPEVQKRDVRRFMESQDRYDSRWAAIESIAAKIG